MQDATSSSLDARLTGSPRTRFWLELFGNSAHFPIANVLLELLLEGPRDYLLAPDLYVIVGASLLQAWWLARWQVTAQPHRLLGNLIGPATYTLVESLIEGAQFFSAPHHLAWWAFALAIGALQSARLHLPNYSASLIVAENVVRTSILFFMYAVFETYADTTRNFDATLFFGDTSHQFIGLVVLFLGVSIGFANLTAERYLHHLRATSAQLRTYSEWLLGRELLRQTFINPATLALAPRERSVLFMDIRGFTRWSGGQSPQAVVLLLNDYYQCAEPVLLRHGAIKFKLSADEVMAVFPTPADACRAALELRDQTAALLQGEGLGAGIGIHAGPLVEGLLGSAGVRFYDVIGDTVNTAKRIEGAAANGVVLASEPVRMAVAAAFRFGPRAEVTAKGKAEPLPVYPLESANG